MLGNTHLAAGVAAALALTQPDSAAECFTAIMGGAAGSIVCDVDAIRGSRGTGAMQGQLIAGSLTAGILLLDSILKTGIWDRLTARDSGTLLTGIGLFCILWILGYFTAHRSFTHSLAALLLFTLAVKLIYPPLVPGFLTAYASHLILDLLNRKPLRLFYPLRTGISFGLFYADSRINRILIHAGNLISAFFILRLLFPHP